MTEFIMLYLNSPLLSFGGVAVDNINPTMEFPAKSLLTGLIANALGYAHSDVEKTKALQKRIEYGVLAISRGVKIQDYQTVDLSQDFLVDTGWTTRGKSLGRDGQNAEGIHIRYRQYLAGGSFLIALTMHERETTPTLEMIAEKILWPERPLFFGRKCCLPADRIFQGRCSAETIEEALIDFFENNLEKWNKKDNEYVLWVPCETSEAQVWSIDDNTELLAITDERDWANQIHSGRRLVIKKNRRFERENHDTR